MSIQLRKKDVLAHFGNNCAEVARAITTIQGFPISRVSVGRWKEIIPELKARKLLDHYPELREYVLDPATGLSLRDMRARLTPGT